MTEFVALHKQKITGILTCFDRLIFHGHLPLTFARNMYRFLRNKQVPLHNFGRFVNRQSESLRASAQQMADQAGRPCIYLQRFRKKEDYAKSIAERDGITEGLVCVLRATEACRSYSLRKVNDDLRLLANTRQCLHLYFYFIDPELGWIHIRLQTWFPFLIQVGINGHEVLARKLDAKGIGYRLIDNVFDRIDDVARAQRLANAIAEKDWTRILHRLARHVNPLLRSLLRGMCYYWVTDQSELATDLVFQNSQSLQPLYQQLLHHSTLCFSAEDVLGFLGRKLHGLYQGEVVTEFQKRHWGRRVKHRAGSNWIKMYDKIGYVLRIETVINRPQDFTVLRTRRTRDGRRIRGRFSLPKSVAYLPRLLKIARRSNYRYLNALAAVTDPATAYRQVQKLGKPIHRRGRTSRGLNPLAAQDRDLFIAVLHGDCLINGFRNEHIRPRLHPSAPTDPKELKRLSARVRRRLLVMRAHGLIARIPRTRRYRVTDRGYVLMSAAMFYCEDALPRFIMNPDYAQSA